LRWSIPSARQAPSATHLVDNWSRERSGRELVPGQRSGISPRSGVERAAGGSKRRL